MASNFKQSSRNFFSSRNGLDELVMISFGVGIIFAILNNFFPELVVFYILQILSYGYGVFRIFSGNVYQREKENAAFLNFFKRLFTKGSKNRPKRQKTIKVKEKKVKVKKEKVKKVKKDKNFIYKNCPHCNNELKISKSKKGNRLIMCTKCYNEISIKV